MPLVCGYHFTPDGPARALDSITEALEAAQGDGAVWIHLNRADTRARRWIEHAGALPPEFASWIDEPDPLERFERVGDALMARFEDFVFREIPDPTEVSVLWAYIAPRMLVTVRSHALQGTDRLRQEAKGGLRAGSGMALFARILESQVIYVESMRRRMVAQVDRAEDNVLTGRLSTHREGLGGVRRTCAHLRRHFAPQRLAIGRLVSGEDISPAERDMLASISQDLGHEMEEAGALYERAKLLQEELAARLAEETNRTLFLLTTISAVFMPMTLVTGIWGMNVAGLPGTTHESAFWWVMALIGATGAVTVAYLVAAGRR
jgi:zinc transporter